MRQHLLGFIPARGGSTRVKDKNARPFAGSNLISLAIRESLGARCLDEIAFSSDSDSHIEMARAAGLEVTYKRPTHLATEKAPMADAVIDYLDWRGQDGESIPTHVVLLQPTSPFRTGHDIEAAVRLWRDSGRKTLVSVVRAAPAANYVLFRDSRRGLITRIPEGRAKEVFVLDGAIFIAPVAMIRDEKRFWDEDAALYVTEFPHPYDIDTELDFQVAEEMFERMASYPHIDTIEGAVINRDSG